MKRVRLNHIPLELRMPPSLNFSHVDVFVSSDIVQELTVRGQEPYADTLAELLYREIENFLESAFIYSQRQYPRVIETVLTERELPRSCAALVAHGERSPCGKWIYFDGKAVRQIDKWIQRHDGRYGLLALCCCNPGSAPIRTSISLALAPNEIYSRHLAKTGAVQVELYIPKEGYFDFYAGTKK